jgi:hypothetical protein
VIGAGATHPHSGTIGGPGDGGNGVVVIRYRTSG